jgi:hypothetical protein
MTGPKTQKTGTEIPKEEEEAMRDRTSYREVLRCMQVALMGEPHRLAVEMLALYDALERQGHPGADEVRWSLLVHCYAWIGAYDSLTEVRGALAGGHWGHG